MDHWTRVGLPLIPLVLACSSAPRPPTRIVPTPVSLAEPAPQSLGRGDPRLLALLEPRIAEAVPDARIAALVPTSESAGLAIIEGTGFRLTLEYQTNERNGGQAYFRNMQALPAMAFLHELDEAGVDLLRTGRWLATEAVGPIRCWDDGRGETDIRCARAPDPEPWETPSLEPANYLLPPSQYASTPPLQLPPAGSASAPRAYPRESVAAITAVLERYSTMRVVGLPLDAEHHALLVSVEDMAIEGVLVCVRTTAEMECAGSSVAHLEGVVAREAWGWLLVGSTSYGNPRDRARLLLAVRPGPHGLIADTLGLGGVSGDGHACDEHDGYCVDMSGMAYRAQLLSPTCIERTPGTRWHSTHVRIDDLWLDEELIEPPRCADRYSIGPRGFEATDCGPPTNTPRCPDPFEEDDP